MDLNIAEILGTFTPLTLTTSISLIKTDEPLILKSRLGKNVITMLDEACVFEVEEEAITLRPSGFPMTRPASSISRANARGIPLFRHRFTLGTESPPARSTSSVLPRRTPST